MHLHPCIPTNVRPKSAISNHNGALRNGRLRLREVANGVSKLGSQLGVDVASSRNFGPISDGTFQFKQTQIETGNGFF
jgi:hypothetical protein